MSEVTTTEHKLLPVNKFIGTVFSDWLKSEVETSMQPENPNAYLDNVDTFFCSDGQQKAKGHYSRTIGWTEEFKNIEYVRVAREMIRLITL